MRIIPAIDILNGNCVRLTQGDFSKVKRYDADPLQTARHFEDSGYTYLHIVDLDGAKAGKIMNWEVLKKITRNTKLNIDFGGGIQSQDDIDQLLNIGIHQVNVGSKAIREPVEVIRWIDLFGPDKIILSADVRGNHIASQGWQEDTSITIDQFINTFKEIRYVACTDILRDGMLNGPNFTLYEYLISKFPQKKIIASGGVQSAADLETLKSSGLDGAIVGKAFYEGKIQFE
ncbi:MAG: 1-(5-phosphoribosyl)-5-[(5-phosphoribosylamino)methylideneamino]imidazole-4-carboxamide isomerase [Flammeovirgaceae bacterium]|nr:1-(5-phosphoribosyl)-5-[(5-phosphoribosylamino)methylideneamino]imidazole-4-carboxamide isomerase [Flammeovirgaceae bacterium]